MFIVSAVQHMVYPSQRPVLPLMRTADSHHSDIRDTFMWTYFSERAASPHLENHISLRQRANKRCEWDELLRFLSRRVKSTWGTGRDQWTPRVVAIARRLRGGQTSAIVLTESDIKFLREKHNVHLLDEIVAIQPHITRISFSGCGLFETTFRRKGRFREAQVAYATYELARWPEDDRSPPQDYQEIADYSEMIPSEYGRVARSAICHVPQRVHGVLHRVLATTTKEIVTHVEREVRTSIWQRSHAAAFAALWLPIFLPFCSGFLQGATTMCFIR